MRRTTKTHNAWRCWQKNSKRKLVEAHAPPVRRPPARQERRTHRHGRPRPFLSIRLTCALRSHPPVSRVPYHLPMFWMFSSPAARPVRICGWPADTLRPAASNGHICQIAAAAATDHARRKSKLVSVVSRRVTNSRRIEVP
jgi:hypothetical protein